MTKETCRVPEFSHEDECAAQDTETCLEESDTKPFEESNPVLSTLQSAIVR